MLIAAAACEMHPRAVLQALELRSVADALDAATRAGAPRPGVTRRPRASSSASACSTGERRGRAGGRARSRRGGGGDEGRPRLPADRHARRARARRCSPTRRASTTSRSSRSTAARSCCSGTCPPQARASRLRAGAARPDLGRSSRPQEFLARWTYRGARDGRGDPPLPEPDAAREWLATMTLIRRFEERAGEMYAKAKVGGFLHLSIGEEATIVGAARALRDARLPDLHLPLARPRARARHAARER